MATERQAPDAVLTSTNLSGGVADIDDDPDSPDANWMVATNNNVNTDVRTSFPTPTGDPNVGTDLQGFRWQVRRTANSGTGVPTSRAELWENGTLVRAGSNRNVTSDSGQVFEFLWNANELGTADGSLVELKIIGTKTGGSPTVRAAVDVGAVEWNVDYSTGVEQGVGDSAGTSTATGDGASTAEADGAASGTSTATGDGASTAAADGAAAGTSTAAGDGASTAATDGTIPGTSTATAAGQSTARSPGASAATSTSSAAGQSTADADGTADGTSTTAGDGAATVSRDGSSTATSTVVGDGAATGRGDGAGAGSATSSAAGESTATGDGAAAGAATSTAIGQSIAAAAGTSAGTSTATAVASAVGDAAGTSTASATGQSTATGDGSSAGTSTATAVASVGSVGDAAGTSTATAVGRSVAQSVASSAGLAASTAIGEATAAGEGAATAVSTAAAVGRSTAQGAGSAAGTSIATAAGESVTESTGTAGGSATSAAAGKAIVEGDGSAAGTSTATAVGATGSVGDAAGTSTATATIQSVARSTGSAAGVSTGQAVAEIGPMTFVELPAVYLDDIQMLEPGGLVLLNRDPDDGQIRVPEDLDVSVDIADLTGIGIDTSATQVFIASVLAFDGGVFQQGFDGSTSNPDPDTLRIVVNPTADFTSEQVVQVRVVSETTGGANTIDETYSFTVVDLIPPAFTSAVPQSLRVVRLTFDDPVKQVDPTALDDALNPLLYRFTPLTFPAVTPVGVSVASVDAQTVDVTVDIDFSPGQTYQVQAPDFPDPTAGPPSGLVIPPLGGG